ncbi:hypothetical protein CBR_g23103 [Chara braunii]|uniref:Uncharacterized protein n=1 Tax=Chara braunii TaxID=69332 RepID=A0A388L3J9_CHABU|nr:hypothetical protein CBR_g23103 [Chara braunii]|eukprot:GBG76889.1 hypothetical protein CBR_g23103 [Chara braunii]
MVALYKSQLADMLQMMDYARGKLPFLNLRWRVMHSSMNGRLNWFRTVFHILHNNWTALMTYRWQPICRSAFLCFRSCVQVFSQSRTAIEGGSCTTGSAGTAGHTPSNLESGDRATCAQPVIFGNNKDDEEGGIQRDGVAGDTDPGGAEDTPRRCHLRDQQRNRHLQKFGEAIMLEAAPVQSQRSQGKQSTGVMMINDLGAIHNSLSVKLGAGAGEINQREIDDTLCKERRYSVLMIRHSAHSTKVLEHNGRMCSYSN